jgi:hypothetical protein
MCQEVQSIDEFRAEPTRHSMLIVVTQLEGAK